MRFTRTLALIALAAIGAFGCESPPAQVVPLGAPEFLCQGVPDQVCKGALDSTGADRASVVRVIVRCTTPVCTVAAGEADVTLVFIDGRQENSGYGWAGAEPGPAQPIPVITQAPLSVQPACVGIPLQRCVEMASTGPSGDGTFGTVTAITVHCDTTCTLSNGQGQTKYEFANGAPSVTASWVYGN